MRRANVDGIIVVVTACWAGLVVCVALAALLGGE